MPGKSRRRRGKYSAQGKKRGRHSQSGVAGQQQKVTQTIEPVLSPDKPAPTPSETVPTAESPRVRYPYISIELRTIGILGVAMLIVLIVLSAVLS